MADMPEEQQATNGLGPTPETEWQTLRSVREEGVLQRMPSGRVIRMRNVTPDRLLRLGQIPDVLAAVALKGLYGQLRQDDLQEFIASKENVEDAIKMAESLRVVCTAALIYPRIVDEPQAEDEIHIDDLPVYDRNWIFMLAFQEADALRSFRFEPIADVDDVPEHGEDEQPAEPDDRAE